MFLLVCVLNTFGLMLAKFLKAAPISGLRRALGASRIDIMRQHLIEVVIVGLLGGVLGLVLAKLGLDGMRVLPSGPFRARTTTRRAWRFSSRCRAWIRRCSSSHWGSRCSPGILAGLYPAWRIGRLSPSTFLKTQ